MRAHDNLASASSRHQPDHDDRYVVAAEVLRHLADPTRLRLLRLLGNEQDVTTLTSHVPASRSSVSQHLGRLRLAGLVRVRRDGRRMLYRLTSDHIATLVQGVLEYADHSVRSIPHHLNDA